MSKIESENQFPTSVKSHNSVLICQNLPIFNPKTLLPILTLIPSLKKSGYKMHPVESENEALTDGPTDGRTLERKFLNGGIT